MINYFLTTKCSEGMKIKFILLSIILFSDKNRGTCNPICGQPYTCTSLQECGLRHTNKGTNEILFHCNTGKMNMICCPPTGHKRPFRSTTDKTVQAMTLTSDRWNSTNNYNSTQVEAQETNDSLSTTSVNHRNLHLLPLKDDCGQTFEDKIVAGEDASLGQFPWMALLGFKSQSGNIFYTCGGTLISQRYVLTAAHCMRAGSAVLDHVRLGEHDTRTPTDCNSEEYCQVTEDIPVEKIIIHENWNNPPLKNDITLLRLGRNAINSSRNISPICLPVDLKKLNLKDESHFRIAGWGKTEWTNIQGSTILQQANIDGISLNDCQICQERRPPRYCPLDERQMCVQGVHGVDVCKGDSGGPLMTVKTVPTYQIGITSFKSVEECGAENIPSIFTRVDKYIQWILDNIEE